MERRSRSVSRPEGRPVPEWMNVLRQVWAIENRMTGVSRYMQAHWKVNGQQRIIIKLVGMYPGITATEIADAFSFHPSTTSGNLKHLVKGGFLTRETHEDDARRACFFLTERGEFVDQLPRGTAEAAVRRALSRAEPAIAQAAQALLGQVLVELDEELDWQRRT